MKLSLSAARELYWMTQRLRGRGAVRGRLAELERNESLTAAEMDALQAQKLRAMAIHSYATVPYWRRIMDERGLRPEAIDSVESLRALPILDRASLTSNREQLVSRSEDVRAPRWNYSSGSTGVRAAFLQDADFREWMRAHQLRTYQWCSGWKLGDPFALLWGSEVYWSLKNTSDRIDNALSNRREFNSFLLSPESIEKFTRQLVDFRPELISSYSNAIMLVAKECRRMGVTLPSLKAVQGTSEPLTPGVRAAVRSTFDCDVYDKYGSRESNIVGHETSTSDGLLIQSENVIVEIIDDDGAPCPPGQRGRVVLTTLNNRAMPLIRYETADVATFQPGRSHEGPFRRMSFVSGRLQDLITVPGGASLDAYFFSYLMMGFPEVLWFQVVQDEPDHLTVRCYSRATEIARVFDAIAERIRHHSRFPFRLSFESLDEIPPSKTGKFRLCVNNLPDAPRVSDLDDLAVWERG